MHYSPVVYCYDYSMEEIERKTNVSDQPENPEG